MSLDTITEDTIPDTIREIEQWICWREKDRDGKTTKIPTKPYRTSGSPNAKTDDTSHWRDFETALNYHRSGRISTNGIGFVFSKETEIVGVDLDSCRNPETGAFDEWAQDVIDRLDSFTEVSPSGTGAHVLLKGRLPDGRNRRGDIEMYDEGRFFTVTGEHVDGTPLEIKRRQDSIVSVHLEYVQRDPDDGQDHLEESSTRSEPTDGNQTDTEHQSRTLHSANVNRRSTQSDIRRRFDTDLPPIDDPALEVALQGLPPQKVPVPVPQSLADLAGPGVPFDDIEVIEKAYNSKSGDKIQALYCGETSLYNTADSEYPSQSEADMALLFYLGFWTGKDPEQMERLFRDSGLFREKWDEQHYGNGATYGGVCVAKTLLELSDYYEPPESETSSQGGEGPESNSSTQPMSSPAKANGLRHPSAPVNHSTESNQTHRDLATSGGPPQPGPASSPSPLRSGPSSSHSFRYREDSIDIGAVEDARRLAYKVTQQHEQLTEQAAYIADLEHRLYWYRRVFGVAPLTRPDPLSEDDTTEIDPSGSPSKPPGEDIEPSLKPEASNPDLADASTPQTDGGGAKRTTSGAPSNSGHDKVTDQGIEIEEGNLAAYSLTNRIRRLFFR